MTTDRFTAVQELEIFPYFREARSATLEIKIVIPPMKAIIVMSRDGLKESKKVMKSIIKTTAEILSAAIIESLSQLIWFECLYNRAAMA